jgi:hypothetical protein
MRRKLAVWLTLAVSAVVSTGCGSEVDLGQALTPTDVFTGWYDAGVRDGRNRLVPSISFRLMNRGDVPIDHVQLTVSFWRDGDDGEWESLEVLGIGGEAVPPGASTAPILVHAQVAYTLEQPRAELFANSLFRDTTAKVFAKRGGRIAPIGEFRLERRILPHVAEAAARP